MSQVPMSALPPSLPPKLCYADKPDPPPVVLSKYPPQVHAILRDVGVDPAADPAGLDPEKLVDAFVGLAFAFDAVEEVLKQVGELYDAASKRLSDHFANIGRESERRHGMTVYVARELWPVIDIPKTFPGVIDGDEKAAARARENATIDQKARMLAALKANPNTEHLVVEQVSFQSLRSWMLHDLQLDRTTQLPILPAALVGILRVAEVMKVKAKKSK